MLAAQAALGDGVAFETLVLRYQSRICRLVRILVGGDRPDAEDLTQETFIRAYRAIEQFRGDSTFRTWLHRIALNVVWSHRARRRQGARLVALEPNPEAGELLPEAATSGDDPEAALIRRQAIDRALSTLSNEARAVVTLRDIQGFGYHEIAMITGVPIGTVESRLFRARRRLRPLLAPLRGCAKAEVTGRAETSG
jgi:RNA polymerase sigma-70 factor (ECF subfamily)